MMGRAAVDDTHSSEAGRNPNASGVMEEGRKAALRAGGMSLGMTGDGEGEILRRFC